MKSGNRARSSLLLILAASLSLLFAMKRARASSEIGARKEASLVVVVVVVAVVVVVVVVVAVIVVVVVAACAEAQVRVSTTLDVRSNLRAALSTADLTRLLAYAIKTLVGMFNADVQKEKNLLSSAVSPYGRFALVGIWSATAATALVAMASQRARDFGLSRLVFG